MSGRTRTHSANNAVGDRTANSDRAPSLDLSMADSTDPDSGLHGDHAAPAIAPPLPRLSDHWWLPVVFVGIGLAAFPFDLEVARWFRDTRFPKLLGEVLNNAEPFGHGVGVVFIALTILALDPVRRWAGAAVILAALAGGMTANFVKLTITRTRPRNLDFAAEISSTFGDWFPWFTHGSAGQSFPSGHTATAAVVAVILAHVYPRGTWWFITLASLVASHRLWSSAHYLSDVGFGAAIGVIGGALVTRAYSARIAAARSAGALGSAAVSSGRPLAADGPAARPALRVTPADDGE